MSTKKVRDIFKARITLQLRRNVANNNAEATDIFPEAIGLASLSG